MVNLPYASFRCGMQPKAAMANGGDMKDLVQMIVLPSEAMQPSRKDGGS